jgi:hypothetical protein
MARLFINGSTAATANGQTRYTSPYGVLKTGVNWAAAGGAAVDVSVDDVGVGLVRLGC